MDEIAQRITIDPIINRKFEMDEIVIDTSLQRKYPVRTLPDEVTKSFVETFFDDNTSKALAVESERNKNLFVDYTYTYLRTNILLNLNLALIERNHVPLLHGEHVEFVYKGGNIVNTFYNVYLRDRVNGICRRDLSRDALASNFKVSDVDYNVSIKTVTSKRFEIVKVVSQYLLYDALSHIVKVYDGMLNDQSPENVLNIDNNDVSCNEIVGKIDVLENIYEHIIHGISRKVIPPEFSGDDIRIINERVNQLLAQKHPRRYIVDIEEIIILTHILSSLLYISPNDNIPNLRIRETLQQLKTYCSEINAFKESQVIASRMYNPDRILKFKNTILRKINELNIGDNPNVVKLHGEKKHKPVSVEVDKTQLTLNNIVITPSKSSIIYPPTSVHSKDVVQTSQLEIIGQPNDTYHYITFNKTIAIRSYNTNVAFDLMRIKFNVTLNNIVNIVSPDARTVKLAYKIPSEFIDVSFSDASDTAYQEKIIFDDIRDSYKFYIVPCSHDIRNKYKIGYYGYSEYQLKTDLEAVLFTKNPIIMPWLAGKADKRLKRYILITLCNEKNENNIRFIYGILKTLYEAIKRNESSDNLYNLICNIMENFTGHKINLLRNAFKVFLKTGVLSALMPFFPIEYEHWNVLFMTIFCGSHFLRSTDDIRSIDVINRIRQLGKFIAVDEGNVIVTQRNFISMITTLYEFFSQLQNCLQDFAQMDFQSGGEHNYYHKYKKYKLKFLALSQHSNKIF